MKVTIRIFAVITIILNIVFAAIYLTIGTGITSGSEDIIKAVQNADSGLALSTLAAIYYVLGVCAVLRIAGSIAALVKLGKPVEKKPVLLGILNIFFGTFVGGILLLCLKPDADKE